MSDEVRAFLVGHGKLPHGLLDAVEQITGTRGGLIPLDNEGLTTEALEERMAELPEGQPCIVFVDLPSGSCAFAARRLQRRRNELAIVCGVNLPLLLDYVFHRSLPLDELLERLRSHAGISIEKAPDGDRSVSN